MVAELINFNSALVEQPLKTSQATGAALAAMGFADCVPLFHGSQGCCAFAKVYLIQHFREPMPFQNTAIDHISAVMGGDQSLIEALATVITKHQPGLVVVMSTGLTEIQGCDLQRNLAEFYQQHPEHLNVPVVVVNCPDFEGSLQTGYAAMIHAVIEQLLLGPRAIAKRPPLHGQTTLNVFLSAAYTPADAELIARYCEAFGFKPNLIPNLGLSLDGHLASSDYSPTTTDGLSLAELASLPFAEANLVFGASLAASAKLLEKHFGMASYNFEMGLESTDQLVTVLSQLSGLAVPQWISRQRQRLQDAMLDTHFLLSAARVALAAEPDLALGYAALFSEIGLQLDTVVTTLAKAKLKSIEAERVVVGDLSVLNDCLDKVDLVLGNTHCANLCEPTVPVHRVGYPCHDRFGNSDSLQFGYEGARQTLFALANLLKQHHRDEVAPHVSPYRFDPEELSHG